MNTVGSEATISNEYAAFGNPEIEELCLRVADGLRTLPECPRCSRKLELRNAAQRVEVRCPIGCFRFACGQGNSKGRWQTGTLDFPGPRGLSQSEWMASN